jgi:hypothetical protein
MSNKTRKDDLKNIWREQERQKLVASIPILRQDLRDLFDYLDSEAIAECDPDVRTVFVNMRVRTS